MSLFMKVLGVTVLGLAVIILYVATTVFGSYLGAASPLSFMIYVGLGLTAVMLLSIMYLATDGGE